MTPEPDPPVTEGPRGGPGLAVRLLAAQLAVVLSSGVALLAVASMVAPGVFTRHLDEAGETDPAVRHHAREAFDAAFGLAMGVSAVVAVAAAVAVSALVVRRLTTPVTQLARAADALAGGDHRVAVPHARLGPEFDRLTGAFAGMAGQLARTDEVRRRLLADLAHEMRTPVATLAAHLDAIEDGVIEPDAATWRVQRDQLDRLRRLSADLAEVTAAEEHALSLDLVPADLSRIAADAVHAAAPRYAAKGVGLGLDAAESLPVLADPVRIQQVLANLLDNALRHTPAGGSVRVRGAAAGVEGVVAVVDTGSGLPAGELEAVFDRFHRVDAARSRRDGGSGLGLTIARAIAVDHGGSLAATSEGEGHGSCFTLRLPLRAPR